MKKIIILAFMLSMPTLAYCLHAGQTVVLTGQAIAGSDTLKNAKITITLSGGTCYTTTDLMPSVSVVTYADANGNWSKSIVGTDSISCVGNDDATYSVQIEHPFLSVSGQIIRYDGLVIPATNGANTTLRSIVAAQ